MRTIAIIPARNEAGSIGAVVRDLKSSLGQLAPEHEIWVIDDASTDGTSVIAAANGALVHSLSRRSSLSNVFRHGTRIASARGADIIVHIDADGQYCPDELPRFFSELANGAQLVIGSRFLGLIETMPFTTKIANRVLTRIVAASARLHLTDAQSGFRVFTKEVAELSIGGTFTYTQAQIIRAARANIRIREVPIKFKKRSFGTSRLIRFRPYAGLRMLLDILAVSLERV